MMRNSLRSWMWRGSPVGWGHHKSAITRSTGRYCLSAQIQLSFRRFLGEKPSPMQTGNEKDEPTVDPAGRDRSRRRTVLSTAALFARHEPDRDGLFEAQDAAAPGARAHPRWSLATHRR